MNGGQKIAEVLKRHGVKFLFTLCGGHISPILVSGKQAGIRVVDVRHEVTAVFAADAIGRLTGAPGVAAVTAGPGLTNTVTAVKNAALAQSPLVLLSGATATVLKGRGALQDIDQLALMEPHVKWAVAVRRLKDVASVLDQALHIASSGVPGPVFVEYPVDLLYDAELVSKWYHERIPAGGGVKNTAFKYFLKAHLTRLLADENQEIPSEPAPRFPLPDPSSLRLARTLIEASKRPILLIGSQAVSTPTQLKQLAASIDNLAIPTYLTGMARGLLGSKHPFLFKHQRRRNLQEADCVIMAGVISDFRLNYGRDIARGAKIIAINRDPRAARKNRRPFLTVMSDPGDFLVRLSGLSTHPAVRSWTRRLLEREDERERQIDQMAQAESDHINPVQLCRSINDNLNDDAVLVADGGDFVATASYVIAPRGPLKWLDPGPFGTLGVGAGFALATKLLCPSCEVWILYGDGSCAYSLAEFDTFVRHSLPVIAVVGNDSGWSQIAREQVELLGDDVGTTLLPANYELVARGYGGEGLKLEHASQISEILTQAKSTAASGKPVLINAIIGRTDFRRGSISM